MEFPFGHHHHRRHDGADDEQPPRFPPYPPPGYNPYQDNYGGGAAAYPPPPVYPPPVHHVSHESNAPPPPPSPFPAYDDDASYHPHVQHVRHEYGAPPSAFSGYPPPAQQHVSHETLPAAAAAYPPADGGYEYGREESHHHQHRHHLHLPFGSSHTVEHVSHDGGEFAGRRTVRVFTKAKEDFSLTVRDGKVVLAPANPRDEYQHWIKDLRYSTKVKDQEGFPSFALVNKVTGEAIKHSIGAKYHVRLVRYKPDYLDESVLWTESADTGEGFRCIRMVNNIGLNFDAFHGDADHGGVHDGTTVVLWEWLKGKNQRWKIVPYCKLLDQRNGDAIYMLCLSSAP